VWPGCVDEQVYDITQPGNPYLCTEDTR